VNRSHDLEVALHMFEVNIDVLPEFKPELSITWLIKVVERALSSEFDRDNGVLNVVVSDDETVRQLNEKYRGLDETTDVLSFSSLYNGEYFGEDSSKKIDSNLHGFVLPPDVSEPIGEVVISYPMALQQAQNSGHSISKELEVLITHGVLHLLGHDHEKIEEATKMTDAQNRIMAISLHY